MYVVWDDWSHLGGQSDCAMAHQCSKGLPSSRAEGARPTPARRSGADDAPPLRWTAALYCWDSAEITECVLYVCMYVCIFLRPSWYLSSGKTGSVRSAGLDSNFIHFITNKWIKLTLWMDKCLYVMSICMYVCMYVCTVCMYVYVCMYVCMRLKVSPILRHANPWPM